MPFSKNETARLRKVAAQLDIVLDALHRAAGEMYVAPLKLYRDDVEELIASTQETLKAIQKELPPKRPAANPAQTAMFDEDDA